MSCYHVLLCSTVVKNGKSMSKKILDPQYMMLLTQVKQYGFISDRMYCFQYSDPLAGDLFMATNNLSY